MSAATCGTCGADIPEGWYFCGQCGSQADVVATDKLAVHYYGPMQAPGRAKLILIVGEAIEGMSYHLNATEHLSGHMNGQLPFDDDYLSVKHSSFFYRNGHLFLRDEGSLNGTYLRIRGQHALEDEDMILAGQHYFRFERLLGVDDTPTRDGTSHFYSPSENNTFRLVEVLKGGLDGRAYASPHGEVAVGREACDIILPDDVNMSKRHFKVVDRDGQAVLTDLDSKNGTFVRIRKEARLFHGDLVFLGKELLRVEITA